MSLKSKFLPVAAALIFTGSAKQASAVSPVPIPTMDNVKGMISETLPDMPEIKMTAGEAAAATLAGLGLLTLGLGLASRRRGLRI
jgi:hypothetical protein